MDMAVEGGRDTEMSLGSSPLSSGDSDADGNPPNPAQMRNRMRTMVQQWRMAGFHVEGLERLVQQRDQAAAEHVFLELRGPIEEVRRLALEARLRGSVPEDELREMVARASSADEYRRLAVLLVDRLGTRAPGSGTVPPVVPPGKKDTALLLEIIRRVVHRHRFVVTIETLRSIHRLVRRSYPVFNFFLVARDFSVRSELPDHEECREALSMYLHLVVGQSDQLSGSDRAEALLNESVAELLADPGLLPGLALLVPYLPAMLQESVLRRAGGGDDSTDGGERRGTTDR